MSTVEAVPGDMIQAQMPSGRVMHAKVSRAICWASLLPCVIGKLEFLMRL